MVNINFLGEMAQKMAYFFNKFELSKHKKSGRGRNCPFWKQKSKKFRRLPPAYAIIVNIEFLGEAAQKMAHFFNKKIINLNLPSQSW